MNDELIVAGRKVKGISFDLEGNLVDLEKFHWRAHKLVAKMIGVNLDLDDIDSVIEIAENFIGGPDESVMEQLITHARSLEKVPTMTAAEMVEEKTRLFKASLESSDVEIKLREGAEIFIRQVIAYGLPIALVSVTPKGHGLNILKATVLSKYFDENRCIFKEDIDPDRRKPHPDAYIAAAEKMGLNPKEILIFENSATAGILAARESGGVPIGMPVIPGREKALMENGAVAVFMSWTELSINALRSIKGPPTTIEGSPPNPEGYYYV